MDHVGPIVASTVDVANICARKTIRMTLKKKQLVECDVIDVAFGGKGLAKIDGLALFIDQTVTGDRVAARVVKKKRNYAEAVVEDLLMPSPFMIDSTSLVFSEN